MNTQDLYDGWSLTAVAGPVPTDLDGRRVRARVPGTSHTALLEAGLIPDPYLDRNEEVLAWMQRTDWAYERDLDLAPAAADERVDLVFDGIDTVATLTFDGQELGRTANQHRSYRFDVRDRLRPTTQRLRVLLHVRAGRTPRPRPSRLGARPLAYPQPFNMVRKMACSFGWDWGPDLQTAGLWRPVRLERWTVARLAEVRPLVTVDADGTGRVEVHADDRAVGPAGGDVPLTVRARVAGADGRRDGAGRRRRRPSSSSRSRTPRCGGPSATATSRCTELHGRARRAGPGGAARHVDPPHRLPHRRAGHRPPTSTAPPFTFRINGRPSSSRAPTGSPTTTCSPGSPASGSRTGSTRRSDANLNLLRVWGGGIYESEDFYELCDERGLLVWQDFLLACAAYPEEEPLCGRARGGGPRARRPPDPAPVAWCCGTAATRTSGATWTGAGRRSCEGRTWGFGYYHGAAAQDVVAELDPTRPYSDGQPVLARRRAHRGAPQRPRPRHPPPVGGLEPRRLHALRRRRPPVLLGVRLPGPADVGHPRPARSHDGRRRPADQGRPDVPAAPEGRGRQRQARPRPGAPPRRARATSPTGTGRPSSTRRAPSGSPSSTTAPGGRARRARSSGSSTTAGR